MTTSSVLRQSLLGLLFLASACTGGSPADSTRSPTAKTPDEPVASTPESTEPAGPGTPAATTPTPKDDKTMSPSTETATFGAGCFWCVEAVLEQLPGVRDVTSGFMGGTTPNPTYRQVCEGDTGHAEVVQVTFDPREIGYDTLLDWFFKLHDPTTLNRQGADEGTQYRSVIFWHSDAQRDAAQRKKREFDHSGKFRDPIVTEIAQASTFYPAESYHQDYYRANKAKNPYCRVVITPKLDKLGLDK